MAVPTITAVTPSAGHSGGQTLVEIDGTNFALPPAAPATGPTTPPPPSVTVTFAGVAATGVMVVSSGLIYCNAPKGDPDAGAVAVAVQNNDASGSPVAGELATKAAAFTFQRPDLTEEAELTRVVRALLQELKRQIHPNVVFSTHTDYDADTGDQLNTALVASLPALILGNLELLEGYPDHSDQDYSITTGFISRRPPVVADIKISLVAVTNNPVELLNLLQVVRMFFRKNAWLTLDRDATDPSQGTVNYPLDWSIAGPASVTHASDGSNVESFSGLIFVRDVLLEDMPGVSRAAPVAIPASFPHEATRTIGAVTASDSTAVVLDVQKK